MDYTNVYIAAASVVTAFISGAVIMRGQKLSNRSQDRLQSNEEVKTIFDGYGQIVEELRIEVQRLMLVIAILQEDQVACEQRNDELLEEIEQLKLRLNQLEGNNE